MRPAFEEGYERHCDLGERPPRTEWQRRHGEDPTGYWASWCDDEEPEEDEEE